MMRPPLSRLFLIAIFASLVSWSAASAQNDATQGSDTASVLPIPDDIQVHEQLGTQLDLDTVFVNEEGQERALRHFFDGEQPVVLIPVFYNCASLCNLTLNQFVTTLADVPWLPGTGFQVVTMTINPLEDPPLAKAKKAAYMEEFGRPGAEKGWHFLTGSGDSIKSVMKAVGFDYRYDAETMQYLHRATLIILTPDGVVEHYFHGAYTPPNQLNIALLKAGDGHLGELKERLWAGVHTYDEKIEKFVLNETLILGVLGGMVLFLMLLAFMAIRHTKRNQAAD